MRPGAQDQQEGGGDPGHKVRCGHVEQWPLVELHGVHPRPVQRLGPGIMRQLHRWTLRSPARLRILHGVRVGDLRWGIGGDGLLGLPRGFGAACLGPGPLPRLLGEHLCANGGSVVLRQLRRPWPGLHLGGRVLPMHSAAPASTGPLPLLGLLAVAAVPSRARHALTMPGASPARASTCPPQRAATGSTRPRWANLKL